MTDWNQIMGSRPAEASVAEASRVLAVPKSTDEQRLTRPRDRAELRAWVANYAGVKLPAKAVCEGHSTPLDYLEYVFFEQGTEDPLVWACRGGAKTLCGAIATLLDMVFKPGIEIRILGGSDVQAERMYEHLTRMVEANFRDMMPLSGRLSRIQKSGFRFSNRSRVELLSQSEKSVRGARVQKVRCDELDLFKEDVWDAVQLGTRSKPAQGIRGSIEALSTMNGPAGMMNRLVKEGKRKLFHWCIWDVVENCQEDCKKCILAKACQSIARNADGFVPVTDVRLMKERVRPAAFKFEVLCNPKATVSGDDSLIRRYY